MLFTFKSDQTAFTRPAILYLCMYIICIIAIPAPANASAWETDPFSPVIAIDPGHGGIDQGARGPGNLWEKDITLLLAQQLAARLRPAYTCVLTRTGDYQLDIFDRTAAANASKADIFISLHVRANFLHKAKASGITLWYYPPAEWRNTEPLAWDTIQQQHTDSSRMFAGLIQARLSDIPSFTPVSVKSAPILVMEGADMTAVLIEMGYRTHSPGGKALQQADTLSALCDALVNAIDDYFQAVSVHK